MEKRIKEKLKKVKLGTSKLTEPIQPTTELKSVSVSRLALFTECHRKFYWKYVRNLVSKDFYAPYFVGGWFHKGIQMFYRGLEPESIMKVIARKVKKELGNRFIKPEDIQNVELQTAVLKGMLRGYFQNYKDEVNQWDVVATEQMFEVNLGYPPIPFVGVIDMLFKEGGSHKLVVGEHKTASRISKGYIERLPMDMQANTYPIFVKKCLGDKLHGVCYNVTRKPSIRVRQGETWPQFIKRVEGEYTDRPADYFYREDLKLNSKHCDEAWKDVVNISEELYMYFNSLTKEQIIDPDTWYRDTRRCFDWNRRCEYYNLCRYGDKADKLMLFNERKEFRDGNTIKEISGKFKKTEKSRRKKGDIQVPKK